MTASNRAAMVYGDDPRALAAALDGEPSVDVALFLEDGEVVARRDGESRTRRSSTSTRTAARARRRLCATRTPARCSLSAAPGWEFADLAGRHHAGGGSHGSLAATDSEVPMLTVGLGEPPASITGIKALVLEHFGVTALQPASVTEPGWIDRQLRRRGIDDERVLAAMARVPRELFVPEELRDYAYEDAALPLAHGQTVSQPFIVAVTCQGARASRATSACSTSAPAPATRRRCSPSSRARCTRSSGSRSSPRPRAPSLAAAGYERVQVHVGDGWLGLPEHAPYDGIAVAAAAPEVPAALWEQLRDGARIVLPLGSRRRQELCAIERTPEGPKLIGAVPARFVPLVQGDVDS